MSELERLRAELSDLRDGRTFHVHTPRDGSETFRCCSPYCDDLGSTRIKVAPGSQDDPTQYRRD